MPTNPTTIRSKTTRRGFAVARRILGVAFVATACFGAFRLGRLWADWRGVSQTSFVPAAVTAQIEAAHAALPLAGHWTFADSDWDFKSRTVAAEQIDDELAAVADSFALDVAPQSTAASQELVEYIRRLDLEPVERDGNQIYRLDRRDLKAVLVVREFADHRPSVAAAFACRQARGAWELFELSPHSSASGALSAANDLLPLPTSATRNGGRFADGGQLLMELVTLDDRAHSAKELLASWHAAGWDVRPSGLAAAGSFSYLCRRGGEVVYAWSADSHDALQNLMLVRTPAPADTGP
jgi:hypothetical protein